MADKPLGAFGGDAQIVGKDAEEPHQAGAWGERGFFAAVFADEDNVFLGFGESAVG